MTGMIAVDAAADFRLSRLHNFHVLDSQTASQYAEDTALKAVKALLQEVAVTPKPGLVDLRNNGAHKDMNFLTFQNSAMALYPSFQKFTEYGINHQDEEPSTFLKGIRSIGCEAEEIMMHATGGVNTHKGAIFSMGILCTAYGYLYGYQGSDKERYLRKLTAKIAAPALNDFKNIAILNTVTAGQMFYIKYGITGIRGEAASGFRNVFDISLPKLKKLLQYGYSLNDAGSLCLVAIMANLIDTNVIHRSSYTEGAEICRRMKDLLNRDIEDCDYIHILEGIDEEFIHRNISPGGSADLLALTYFIWFMEKGDFD
jgi:holo-ACP synthase/triphosphoribosyl-dephospho-CoA synthase